MQFHLYLPQLRLPFSRLVSAAQAAESAGFTGIAGMDHLAPPAARQQPIYEAMDEPAGRVRRLRETLEVLKALWSGEAVNYDGSFHHLHGARQAPVPLGRIPVVIGGTGPKTLALVSEYADWWNLPLTDLHRLEQARSLAGDARVSVQQLVAYVGRGADRDAVAAEAARRFGAIAPPVTGTAAELVDHFGRLADQGIERVYAWFADFAPPDTLAAFGAEVIAPLSGP